MRPRMEAGRGLAVSRVCLRIVRARQRQQLSRRLTTPPKTLQASAGSETQIDSGAIGPAISQSFGAPSHPRLNGFMQPCRSRACARPPTSAHGHGWYSSLAGAGSHACARAGVRGNAERRRRSAQLCFCGGHPRFEATRQSISRRLWLRHELRVSLPQPKHALCPPTPHRVVRVVSYRLHASCLPRPRPLHSLWRMTWYRLPALRPCRNSSIWSRTAAFC